MRKIILMAVAGYLWKKYQANRAAAPATDMSGPARAPGAYTPADLS